MTKIAAAVSALAFSLAFGDVAAAGTMTFGTSRATQCFRLAEQGQTSRTAIDTCDVALGEEVLTGRNRAGTFVNRGVLHMNRRDYVSAAADFEAALNIEPELGEAFFNRGSLRVAEGRFNEAVQDIERGLSLGLVEPEKAYFNRALAKEALDDSRGAYLDYREAARLKPGWELPRMELARFTVRRR
jgi:tetratricopeptide (TPR) repeat protein